MALAVVVARPLDAFFPQGGRSGVGPRFIRSKTDEGFIRTLPALTYLLLFGTISSQILLFPRVSD